MKHYPIGGRLFAIWEWIDPNLKGIPLGEMCNSDPLDEVWRVVYLQYQTLISEMDR